LIDTEEGYLLIENVVNIFCVTSLSVSLHNLLDFYIYISHMQAG
jgi:spore coat polysaccharide biosynthesis protein SpsF (cytidylyltransferase family)